MTNKYFLWYNKCNRMNYIFFEIKFYKFLYNILWINGVIMKEIVLITIVLAFSVFLCGCEVEQTAQSELNSSLNDDKIPEISTNMPETIDASLQSTASSDNNKNNDVLYPPDYYSQTIPPEEKSSEFYTFRTNPTIFSCTISDNNLTNNEKIEAAARILAEEYIKSFSKLSDKYSFCILEYRNVSVDFLEHTIDYRPFDMEHYSISNGIGNMEVSENAWVIDFDSEIRFSGSFDFVSSLELGGENEWNSIPDQGMNEKYLLYKQDEVFYLWSRDVYHYKK